MTAEEYIERFNTKLCQVSDRQWADHNIKALAHRAVEMTQREERKKAMKAFSEVSKECEKCNKKCSVDCSISCLEDKFKELINK